MFRRTKSAERRAHEFEESAAELRSAVRVFVDYAGTVLWFTEGPVDYADAHLSSELEASMREWEDDYYRSIDQGFAWVSDEARARHFAVGLDVTTRLSEELGSEFEVEVFDEEARKRRLRSASGPTNPRAADAFRTMVERDVQATAEWAEVIRSGAKFRFEL